MCPCFMLFYVFLLFIYLPNMVFLMISWGQLQTTYLNLVFGLFLLLAAFR